MIYYLTDGVYLSWATLMKNIHVSQGNKRKYFVVAQESTRKYVERVFEVIQAKFEILSGLVRYFHNTLLKISITYTLV